MYVACRQVVDYQPLLAFEASDMDRTAGSVPKNTLNKPCALLSSMVFHIILAGPTPPAEDVQLFVTGFCIVIMLNATALGSLGRQSDLVFCMPTFVSSSS